MKTTVLDSYALICYLENEPGAEAVAELFTSCVEHARTVLVCVINWGEVLYHARRVGGEATARRVEDALRSLPIKVVDADQELTRAAAVLKAQHPMAYADCFAAALAKTRKATLVTGDKEFRAVESGIKISWL